MTKYRIISLVVLFLGLVMGIISTHSIGSLSAYTSMLGMTGMLLGVIGVITGKKYLL